MTKTELLKIAKPILFNTKMVKAILDGRKTVTRRVVNPQIEAFGKAFAYKGALCSMDWVTEQSQYKIGDILYVRETWAKIEDFKNYMDLEIPDDLKYLYKCSDDGEKRVFVDVGVGKHGWKPSIHMPKSAARIFLKITDVRVERLQDIDKYWGNYDKEGMRNPKTENISIAMQERFIDVWDNTIKKQDLDKYGWNANPWVWVYEFERVECDENN